MATRSRIIPVIDVGRLRAAIAGPGADPRTWGFEGRIDDDEDAIRWDSKMGWICDVTVVGGQLDGEGPIACRVSVPYGASANGGTFHPPTRGQNVVCMLPSADLNSNPIIIGYMFTDDASVPTSFGDLEANEDNLQNTHAMKSDKDVDMEFAGKMTADFSGNGKATFGNELQFDATTIKLRDQVEVTASQVTIDPSAKVKIDALLIDLAGATQPFVRGTDLTTALATYAASIASAPASAMTGLGGTPLGVNDATALTAAYVTATTALVAQLQLALSLKIKGE